MPPRIVPITCPYSGTSVQAYYVDAERPALIDTGGAAHPMSAIAAGLAAAGTSLDRIEVIINTHGHWDHAGGNGGVQAAARGTETWIHERGAHYLVSAAPHVDGYATAQARLLSPALTEAISPSFADLFVPSSPADRTFTDGAILDLGDVRLRAIHVPGHSDDLAALYWEDEGVLIVSDAAQGTGSRVGGCPLYFASAADARHSIRRLMEIPFKSLHTGHPFGRLSTPERTTRYDAQAGMAFLTESLEALDLMESGLAAALPKHRAGPFPALVAASIAHVRETGRWAPMDDPALGVPTGAAPTIDTLRRELHSSS